MTTARSTLYLLVLLLVMLMAGDPPIFNKGDWLKTQYKNKKRRVKNKTTPPNRPADGAKVYKIKQTPPYPRERWED